MPDELHTELKAALAYDKSSFADFFNKAAEDYLSNRKADKQKKTESKAKAAFRSGEKGSVGSKIHSDGAKSYDGGRSPSIYSEMQYGQRYIAD